MANSGEKKLTPLQFAQEYADGSGVSLKFLAEHDFVVLACEGGDCDWSTCKGWVMETENYVNNCIKGNISLPDERHYLRDMVEKTP